MFNFAELKNMTQQIQQRHAQRGDQFAHLYLTAVNLLEQYSKSNAQETLKLAMKKVLEAMDAKPNRPEPYLFLAYIFHCSDQQPKALKYLHVAEELGANLPQIELIREMILTASTAPNLLPDESQKVTDVHSELDILHDKVSALIDAQTRQAPPKALVPTLDPRLFLELQNQHQSLLNFVTDMNSQIDILDQEIDVSDLHLKLKPFEVQLQGLDNSLKVSKEMLHLKQVVARMNNQLTDLRRKLVPGISSTNLAELEDQLEHFLDDCDHLADALDSYSDKGYQIGPVEADYELLVLRVESVQESFDEAHEPLPSDM